MSLNRRRRLHPTEAPGYGSIGSKPCARISAVAAAGSVRRAAARCSTSSPTGSGTVKVGIGACTGYTPRLLHH
ncbi:hypothetical protein [Streptomyces microflavus]|uniref:hypothetical protein n=1 Tax=Streptomyces microflavus TaxID=1919 RepID=UPI003659A068